MGIHGVIEFGNRMMTGVVIAIALVMFLLIVADAC
jgi:cytochrome c oxidase assembly protein subunit 15